MMRIGPIISAILGATGLVMFAKAAPDPWLVNESASLPRGLYLRTPVAPALGQIVAVTPPPAARSYLAALGARPDARLLKRVVATSGDVVCRNGQAMAWPRGIRLARSRDRRGRPLPVWAGCRRLDVGEVLVMGDTAASFDSRYFGPVPSSAIQGVYREIWRW
jgi:type IV secretory pathway protease TraF